MLDCLVCGQGYTAPKKPVLNCTIGGMGEVEGRRRTTLARPRIKRLKSGGRCARSGGLLILLQRRLRRFVRPALRATVRAPARTHDVREEEDRGEDDADAREEDVCPARPETVQDDLDDGDEDGTEAAPDEVVLQGEDEKPKRE